MPTSQDLLFAVALNALPVEFSDALRECGLANPRCRRLTRRCSLRSWGLHSQSAPRVRADPVGSPRKGHGERASSHEEGGIAGNTTVSEGRDGSVARVVTDVCRVSTTTTHTSQNGNSDTPTPTPSTATPLTHDAVPWLPPAESFSQVVRLDLEVKNTAVFPSVTQFRENYEIRVEAVALTDGGHGLMTGAFAILFRMSWRVRYQR